MTIKAALMTDDAVLDLIILEQLRELWQKAGDIPRARRWRPSAEESMRPRSVMKCWHQQKRNKYALVFQEYTPA
jgi:hypothetical protein